MKICTKCLEEKLLSCFHRDKGRRDGYRDLCKECVVNYMKSYYSKNKEKIMSKVIDWISKNRDRHNKKCLRWARENKGKVNARTARRYAKKTLSTPKWLGEDLWLIDQAYELAALRTKILGFQWEVDHIIPLRGKLVSGLHVPNNLRVIPMNENRVKSNRHIS